MKKLNFIRNGRHISASIYRKSKLKKKKKILLQKQFDKVVQNKDGEICSNY
jgi:hypothetical protein